MFVPPCPTCSCFLPVHTLSPQDHTGHIWFHLRTVLINWYSGLWHTCIFTEDSCWCLGTRALAMVVTFPGLEGVELGSGRQQGLKRGLLIVSDVLFWVLGLTTLAPVSLVAYMTVVEFWDENLPDVVSCWEFGEAMFSGWFSGLFLVIGGSLFFVAVYMADHNRQQRVGTLKQHNVTPSQSHFCEIKLST
uniref:Claudin 26 n=1 Tax=Salmo trutta TaxID=8032 RepID=A0A673XYN4_SALTR